MRHPFIRLQLREVDAETGTARTIIDERGDPLVGNSLTIARAFNGGREIIWSSERDGWNHFYLYDAESAALRNRITKGEWVVRSISYIDAKARVLFFTAGNCEPGRNPYLRHLYRVKIGGN